MTYRNARLIVGVLNIAAALFLCGLAFWESIPVRLFPKNEIFFLPHFWCFVQTFVFYSVLSAPFDLLGGLVLPWWFQRDYQGGVRFLLNWIRGVFLHAMVAVGGAILLMVVGRFAGKGGALVAAGFLIGTLLMFGGFFSKLLGERKENRIAGLRNFLVSFIWNYGGVLLASRFSEVSFYSAAGIVTLGVSVSLWSFLGVLIVPLFLGDRSSRIHQSILFPSWICFGFLSRCLPAVVGLPEYWITGNVEEEEGVDVGRSPDRHTGSTEGLNEID